MKFVSTCWVASKPGNNAWQAATQSSARILAAGVPLNEEKSISISSSKMERNSAQFLESIPQA